MASAPSKLTVSCHVDALEELSAWEGRFSRAWISSYNGFVDVQKILPEAAFTPFRASEAPEPVISEARNDEIDVRYFVSSERLAPTTESRKTFATLAASWAAANIPAKQIERVIELASEIFEDVQFAKNWLNRPNLATDNKPPVALLGTDEGFARVQTLLHRIAHGILA